MAWQHRGARDGFEVAFVRQIADGYAFRGCTTAVEDGHAWVVRYAITLGRDWLTKSASITTRTATREQEMALVADGKGSWSVDGVGSLQLAGCLDVDLEASLLTNAFPVHRLRLSVGQDAQAPAVYVRVDGAVERLEQRYRRGCDHDHGERYDYSAPAFHVRCQLDYDDRGFVLDYPGLGTRRM